MILVLELYLNFLQEQGYQEIKLADGSKVSVKKEFRATLPKDDLKEKQPINGFEIRVRHY